MADIITLQQANDFVLKSWRPDGFTSQGTPTYREQIVTNTFLHRREWERLDKNVIQAVGLRLNGINHLRSRGLIRKTTLAEQLAQWSVASDKSRPTVTMDGRTTNRNDRTDKLVQGTPIPIIRQDYSLGMREVLSARSYNTRFEGLEATESGKAVGEEMERMLFQGSSVVVNSQRVYGYKTLPSRLQGVAADFGGGSFSNIDNIKTTFIAVLAEMTKRGYPGPFGVYLDTESYYHALKTYSDGSGQTPLQRVLAIPGISFVERSDMLDSSMGEMTWVQLTQDVITLIIALDVENREWGSPDKMEDFFAVLASCAPRLVTDYNGHSGIAHVTETAG